MFTCHLCGITAAREEAINRGWIPGFFDEEKDCEVLSPVCTVCIYDRLHFDTEYDDHVLPQPAPPSPAPTH